MRYLHTVTAPDRVMPDTAQPKVERVLDGQEHIVRMDLGPWAHEYLLDLFKVLDRNPRLRALVTAELINYRPAGTLRGNGRELRRTSIANQLNTAMAVAGCTSHDMTAAQADDLAEALTAAAVDPQVCRHDGYDGDCPNYTDTEYCTDHDGNYS